MICELKLGKKAADKLRFTLLVMIHIVYRLSSFLAINGSRMIMRPSQRIFFVTNLQNKRIKRKLIWLSLFSFSEE